MPEVNLHLSDDELSKVRAYGQHNALSDEQAASALVSDGLAARHKKAFHRPPAKIYQMPKRSV